MRAIVLAAAGVEIERVGLIGGGAKSALWTRMIAAATGFTVVRMTGGETGPAYGAARLARIAATGESPEAVCLPPEIADVTEPDPDLVAKFRSAARALQGALRCGQAGVPELAARGAGRPPPIALTQPRPRSSERRGERSRPARWRNAPWSPSKRRSGARGSPSHSRRGVCMRAVQTGKSILSRHVRQASTVKRARASASNHCEQE